MPAKKKAKSKAKGKGKPGRRKGAVAPLVQARVEDLLRIRLDGAQTWDMSEYVAEESKKPESPWHLKEGEEPLCERTLQRYVVATNKLIAEAAKGSRKQLLERHLAQRRSLYARAVLAGETRAALAILADEAQLLDLYPSKRVEHSGPGGKPIKAKVTHDAGPDLAPYAAVLRSFLQDPGGGDVPPDRPPESVDSAQAHGQAGPVPAP